MAAGTLLTLRGGPMDAAVMSTLLRPVAESFTPSASGPWPPQVFGPSSSRFFVFFVFFLFLFCSLLVFFSPVTIWISAVPKEHALWLGCVGVVHFLGLFSQPEETLAFGWGFPGNVQFGAWQIDTTHAHLTRALATHIATQKPAVCVIACVSYCMC